MPSFRVILITKLVFYLDTIVLQWKMTKNRTTMQCSHIKLPLASLFSTSLSGLPHNLKTLNWSSKRKFLYINIQFINYHSAIQFWMVFINLTQYEDTRIHEDTRGYEDTRIPLALECLLDSRTYILLFEYICNYFC